jgi:hypothetical protein
MFIFLCRVQELTRPTRRPLVAYVITAYVGIKIYERVVLDPLDRALEQEMKDMPAEDLEQEKALFIPFPGTTKQLRPRPYRGNDPEWKEFIKFSKDRSLQDKVRGEFHRIVNFDLVSETM